MQQNVLKYQNLVGPIRLNSEVEMKFYFQIIKLAPFIFDTRRVQNAHSCVCVCV